MDQPIENEMFRPANPVPDKKSSKYEGFFKDAIEALQPDTNNLVILVVGAIVVIGFYMGQDKAMRMADTAIGGLLGYLGATRKDWSIKK